MGMDISIDKFKGVACKTELDFEDIIYNSDVEEIEVCYWRKHYWLDDWFKQECKHGNYYDGLWLMKEDVINFYNYCNDLLTNGHKKYKLESDDFYCCLGSKNWNKEDILNEIKDTMKQIKPLLNEDFENNVFRYTSG